MSQNMSREINNNQNLDLPGPIPSDEWLDEFNVDPTTGNWLGYTRMVNDEGPPATQEEVETAGKNTRPMFTAKHYSAICRVFKHEGEMLISNITPLLEYSSDRVLGTETEFAEALTRHANLMHEWMILLNTMAWMLQDENKNFNWDMFKDFSHYRQVNSVWNEANKIIREFK